MAVLKSLQKNDYDPTKGSLQTHLTNKIVSAINNEYRKQNRGAGRGSGGGATDVTLNSIPNRGQAINYSNAVAQDKGPGGKNIDTFKKIFYEEVLSRKASGHRDDPKLIRQVYGEIIKASAAKGQGNRQALLEQALGQLTIGNTSTAEKPP